MSNTEFETSFRQKSGQASISRPPPDDALVQAASNVFDSHQTESDFSAQFDLADDLLANPSTHSGNELFERSDTTTGRTSRKDRKQSHRVGDVLEEEKNIAVISSNKSTSRTLPETPTTKSDSTQENSEEFDLDL